MYDTFDAPLNCGAIYKFWTSNNFFLRTVDSTSTGMETKNNYGAPFVERAFKGLNFRCRGCTGALLWAAHELNTHAPLILL